MAIIIRYDLPAQMDDLTNENNATIKGYGTLLVVPAGNIHSVTYDFTLPASILNISGRNFTYKLTVQKQAGTLATPFELTVRLPSSASVIYASLPAKQQGVDWIFSSDLRQDLQFELTFSSN